VVETGSPDNRSIVTPGRASTRLVSPSRCPGREGVPPDHRAGTSGFVTAAVVDPFGNVLGVRYTPHYLEILRAKEQG
jgi:hypothetical protein